MLRPSSFPSKKCNFKAAVLLRSVVVFVGQQTGSAELPARVNKVPLPAQLKTRFLLFYNIKISPRFRTLAMGTHQPKVKQSKVITQSSFSSPPFPRRYFKIRDWSEGKATDFFCFLLFFLVLEPEPGVIGLRRDC